MVQQCAACGFAADTTVTLPEAWVAYLVSERGFDSRNQEMDLPVCLGCQRTVETLLDPKHPTGGKNPDTAVRAFLDDITHPHQSV